MDAQILLQSALILFAIVNPVGSIPIFLQLTERLTPLARRQAFSTGVLTSFIILIGFAFAGKWILTNFFRIQVSDLMAAGGLLLLIIAIDHLVFGALVKGVLAEGEPDAHHIGAVPIGSPILAGPGAMITVILIYSEHGIVVAVGAILAVLGATWLILNFVDRIYGALGKVVCLVLSKILCLFLAAIGIHLLMQGLSVYFK